MLTLSLLFNSSILILKLDGSLMSLSTGPFGLLVISGSEYLKLTTSTKSYGFSHLVLPNP